MRRTSSPMVVVFAILVLVMTACTSGTSPTAEPSESAAEPSESAAEPTESVAPTVDYKACMVSDTGGIDDNSFNENGWAGMERARDELGVEVTFLESSSAEDYARNIDQHIADGCDMIVTVGFLLGDATAAAADANPDTRFAIVDFAYEPGAHPNIEGLVYATSEGAMLAGYASASWSKTGIVGTFGGINIGPGVTDFMDGFIAGVNYWNEQESDDVRVLGGRVPSDPDSGTFTGNFDSTDDAKAKTQGFLDEGADVILPVGGPIGGGTFAAIEESGAEAVGLGVDVDWSESAPDTTPWLLTSIIKRIDNSVFQAVERALNDETVQDTFLSNLENDGVGLAPFHDYDGEISQEVKDAIAEMQEMIIAGDLVPSDYYGE